MGTLLFKNRRRRVSLATRLVLVSCALVSLSSLFFGIFLLHDQLARGQWRLESLGMLMTKTLAAGAEFSLYVEDRRQLQQMASVLARQKDIAYVAVYGAGDALLAVSFDTAFDKLPRVALPHPLPLGPQHRILTPTGLSFSLLEVTVPVNATTFLADGEPAAGPTQAPRHLGYVQIAFNLDSMRSELARSLPRIFAVLALLLALGAAVAVYLTVRITMPLRRLTLAAKKIGDGDFGVTIESRGNDEIHDVVQAFSVMAARLAVYQRDEKKKSATIIKTAQEKLLEEKDLRLQAERELATTRQLESLGLLAGGIAHDFNNLLMAILGNITLARLVQTMERKAQECLLDAEKACRRATDLTRQLLTFAKGGAPVKQLASVAQVVRDTAGFALRGSRSRVEFDFSPDLLAVNMDVGQISQVVHNLTINADQVMPKGGIIRVACKNVLLEEGEVFPLPAGKYVKIEIRDNGAGIPAASLEHIFDPYFTTKEKGSGLGLASAWSIVKNHDGKIVVQSAAGVGSSFQVYLPAADGAMPRQESPDESLVPGRGRILMVDDEETVRGVTSHMLEHLGYEVQIADSGAEALRCYRDALKKNESFDVVLMDLTMPGGMGGDETAALLLALDPGAAIVVASGYGDNPVLARYREYGFRASLMKPFSVQDLGRTLAAVLDSKKLPGNGAPAGAAEYII